MKGKFDKEVITQLLNRFMSGETSLDEEKTLADYFRTHEVEAEWLEYKQMFALFDNGQVDVAGSVRTWHPFRWLAAGIAAGIILLVGLPLLLKDDTAKEKTPVIARQSVSRTSPQPVPQPVAEEKTENAIAEVQLAPQPAGQPARKRRKAAQGSDDDIQSAPVEEPVPTESEPTIQYQNIQTVHLSSDVVMRIIEASDMPAAPTVPSVSEIRARGLLLTDNVRQASQTTFKF